MKEEELISVIIPVYNVEKYLNKCLDSVISQTYNNIEIILIDDGSPDKCGVICDEYSKKDKRIKVIHKNNEGVSIARNLGIEKAKGEYITFIDSDDYVEKNYIETLYKMCKKNNSDMSICGTIDVNETGKIVSESKKINKNMTNVEALQELLEEKHFNNVVWAKLYKLSLLDNIKFKENIKIAEDIDVIYKVLDKTTKVSIDTNNILYYYRIRKNSVTQRGYNNDWKKAIEIIGKMTNYIIEKYPKLKKYAIKRYIKINVFCICQILKYGEHMEEIYILKKNILKYKKYKYYKFKVIDKIKIFLICNKIDLLKKMYALKK